VHLNAFAVVSIPPRCQLELLLFSSFPRRLRWQRDVVVSAPLFVDEICSSSDLLIPHRLVLYFVVVVSRVATQNGERDSVNSNVAAAQVYPSLILRSVFP
jgi:hypothetical protein